jgi:ATP-dependent RNA helicase RhlE
VYHVEKRDKRDALSRLIGSGDWRQVLVFTRTKHGANRLARQLEEDGLGAAAIHGNKSQAARTRALADFKAGNVRVLVATDIAARGLDIDQLPHVVNFELPEVPEFYVHRIGRTGRAGHEGVAASLVSGDERPLLAAIERLVGQRIPVGTIPAAGPRRHAARHDYVNTAPNDDRAPRRGNEPRHDAGRQERAPRQAPQGHAQRAASGPSAQHHGQHHGRPRGKSRAARRRAARAARRR